MSRLHYAASIVATVAGCLDPAANGVCTDHVGERQTISTIAEVETALVGSWQRCTGRTLGPDDQRGIEFTTDGRFRYLRKVYDDLIPGQGAAYTGTFEILDTSAWNGLNSFQLNLYQDYPLGMRIGSVAVYASPRQFSLSETGGDHLYEAL